MNSNYVVRLYLNSGLSFIKVNRFRIRVFDWFDKNSYIDNKNKKDFNIILY